MDSSEALILLGAGFLATLLLEGLLVALARRHGLLAVRNARCWYGHSQCPASASAYSCPWRSMECRSIECCPAAPMFRGKAVDVGEERKDPPDQRRGPAAAQGHGHRDSTRRVQAIAAGTNLPRAR